jgi:hypothetical protein
MWQEPRRKKYAALQKYFAQTGEFVDSNFRILLAQHPKMRVPIVRGVAGASTVTPLDLLGPFLRLEDNRDDDSTASPRTR